MAKTKRGKLEYAVEVFGTGAMVNMLMGGVGAVIIQFFIQQPAFIKTIFWWVGVVLISIPLGYTLQKYYKEKKFSPGLHLMGIGVGAFFLVITSSFATLFFPWANASAQASLQGPGMVSADPTLSIIIPSIAATLICVIMFMVFVIKDN